MSPPTRRSGPGGGGRLGNARTTAGRSSHSDPDQRTTLCDTAHADARWKEIGSPREQARAKQIAGHPLTAAERKLLGTMRPVPLDEPRRIPSGSLHGYITDDITGEPRELRAYTSDDVQRRAEREPKIRHARDVCVAVYERLTRCLLPLWDLPDLTSLEEFLERTEVYERIRP